VFLAYMINLMSLLKLYPFSGCGGNFTAEHGSFTSPGYPNEYPMNTECVWTMYAPPGNKIMIAFR